ncbi:MAG: CPBP family intramembrane glutamic endopeptidase [Myxococcota bacterium]
MKDAWQSIGLYLLFTLLFTAVFGGLMGFQGSTPRLLITGVMWSPGLAALATCALRGRAVASLPWRWPQGRWIALAWALPIAYGLAIYLPVWMLELGGSRFGNPETLKDWSVQLLGAGADHPLAAAVHGAMLVTLGIPASLARALGEEIGWRGFLVWELRKLMPFWAVGIVSGMIWAVWHWPAILFTDYNAGTGSFLLQLAIFTLAIAPQGIVYAYFAFKSGSLWPAAILHASHNLLIQRVYTPLTLKGEESHLYIDEFGIVMPILGAAMAAYFLWLGHRENLGGSTATTDDHARKT